MVIASGGYVQNVVDSNQGKTMSAIGVLICHDNSYPFQERTLSLGQPIKIGRSVARARATTDNAIFDCKVLSRNHALLWYDSGKFYLKDTKSSNGTFVNNKRLSPSGEESTASEVCSGDVVQFGVDVVESTKKVTHGCIIATLKLYLPDGQEAKAAICNSVAFVNVTLEDLYKLNQYIQEASRREVALRSKLEYMQQLLEHTKVAANQSWKALILEDCLLSRLEMLENQVVTYSKSFGDDKLRIELATLLEDKIQYQNATKELLQKKVQEKRDIIGKVQILRCLLSETEEETQSLHNVIKNNQNELQELAIKYVKTQQVLEETTENLNKTKTKLKDLIQQSENEKKESRKVFDDQKTTEKYLQLCLKNSEIDIVNTYNQMYALRNYMITLQDAIYTTTKAYNTQDFVSPFDAINIQLHKSSSSSNILSCNNLNDKKFSINHSDLNSYDNAYDTQLNKWLLVSDNYLKNKYSGNNSAIECGDYKYILPPASNKDMMSNYLLDQICTKESLKQNYCTSKNLHSNSLIDIKNENEIMGISISSDNFSHKQETNSSVKLTINFSDNKHSIGHEDAIEKTVKSQLDCSSSENFSNDLVSANIMKSNQQIYNMLENYDSKFYVQTNENELSTKIELNADCLVNSSKPLTSHLVLSKFFQYLVLKNVAQSSNFLDANKKSEKYKSIIQELQEMKKWLLHESDEIIINKLKTYYHQFEIEFQNIQELSEQLVIFKEKYHSTAEEDVSANDKSVSFQVQYDNVSNTTYMVPVYYVIPIIFALIWMLIEKLL